MSNWDTGKYIGTFDQSAEVQCLSCKKVIRGDYTAEVGSLGFNENEPHYVVVVTRGGLLEAVVGHHDEERTFGDLHTLGGGYHLTREINDKFKDGELFYTIEKDGWVTVNRRLRQPDGPTRFMTHALASIRAAEVNREWPSAYPAIPDHKNVHWRHLFQHGVYTSPQLGHFTASTEYNGGNLWVRGGNIWQELEKKYNIIH